MLPMDVTKPEYMLVTESNWSTYGATRDRQNSTITHFVVNKRLRSMLAFNTEIMKNVWAIVAITLFFHD